jgi:hypothetical protein
MVSTTIAAVGCGAFGSESTQSTNDGGTASDAANVEDMGSSISDVRDGGTACPDGAFCDSFERTTADIKGLWNGVAQENGGTLTIDPAKVGALGSSLHITLADTANPRALLNRVLKTQQAATITFWLRVDAPPTRNVHLVAFAPTTGSTPYVFLRLKQGGLFFVEQDLDLSIDNEYPCPMTPGQWARYELGLRPAPVDAGTDAAGSKPHAKLSREGTTCVDRDLTITVAAIDRLLFGVTYAPAGAPYELWLDEVVLESR